MRSSFENLRCLVFGSHQPTNRLGRWDLRFRVRICLVFETGYWSGCLGLLRDAFAGLDHVLVGGASNEQAAPFVSGLSERITDIILLKDEL